MKFSGAKLEKFMTYQIFCNNKSRDSLIDSVREVRENLEAFMNKN